MLQTEMLCHLIQYISNRATVQRNYYRIVV